MTVTGCLFAADMLSVNCTATFCKSWTDERNYKPTGIA